LSAIFLDTCAILWLLAGVPPRAEAMDAIEAARGEDNVLISPISAWEIAMKERRRPGSLGLSAPALDVYRFFLRQAGVRAIPLSPEILVASVDIAGLETNDPADRMIVASARATTARVVTGDRRILSYDDCWIDYGNG
jgi:PIN domain nuclease of toxin-antitoxin system